MSGNGPKRPPVKTAKGMGTTGKKTTFQRLGIKVDTNAGAIKKNA